MMASAELHDRLVVVLVAGLLVIVAILAFVYPLARPAQAQNVREFFLTAQSTALQPSAGVTWNAWTYNGTVPGPTLRVRVGDLVRIHFTNNLDLRHSIHLHGLRYTIENDGSQAYPASMPGPGQSYTYTYEATRPGLFYYHCHSSDGGHPIAYHIQQGLFGAIIVYPADQWPPTTTYEFIQFFGEAPGVGYHINGKQAWEHDLQTLVETQGYDGAFQTLKAAGYPTVPVGTELTFYIVAIGDQYHSWHMHGGSPVFVNGEAVEGDVIPLVPGTAAIARVRVANPGIWLIHCHVVFHADSGMVTLVLAE